MSRYRYFHKEKEIFPRDYPGKFFLMDGNRMESVFAEIRYVLEIADKPYKTE